MGTMFWVRRYLVVFAGTFVIIVLAHLARGRTLDHATTEGAIWALLSASVFTAARIYQSKRGQHCAVCRDTPEFKDPQSGPQA